MRNNKTVYYMLIGFLVGISILLYPFISDFWNSKRQTRAIVNYESVLEELEDEDYTAVFERAHAYNKALYNLRDPLVHYEEVEGYFDTLNVTKDQMIGYIKIDRINVELPIYHGTSESVLSQGVGHFQGSSLPVGGKNTHSILSAHRGLPSSKLFTDLDRVEIGDTFEIVILDQIFTYQVDQIKVIDPTETGDLYIIEGEDYCTLLTCTPYGINTHRLLVRGVRVETIKEKPLIYISNEAFRIDPLIVTPAVAAPMLFVFLIHLLVKYREPPQQNKQEEIGGENDET